MQYQQYTSVLQCVGLSSEDLEVREVEHIDIALEDIPEKNFKKEEVRLIKLTDINLIIE